MNRRDRPEPQSLPPPSTNGAAAPSSVKSGQSDGISEPRHDRPPRRSQDETAQGHLSKTGPEALTVSDLRPISSGWQILKALPDLRRVDIVALDIETNDEGLRADRGSAWPWRGGYICGISVAYRTDGDIRAHYFPLCHPDSENFDREQVFQWLRDHVASDVGMRVSPRQRSQICWSLGHLAWGCPSLTGRRVENQLIVPPSV